LIRRGRLTSRLTPGSALAFDRSRLPWSNVAFLPLRGGETPRMTMTMLAFHPALEGFDGGSAPDLTSNICGYAALLAGGAGTPGKQLPRATERLLPAPTPPRCNFRRNETSTFVANARRSNLEACSALERGSLVRIIEDASRNQPAKGPEIATSAALRRTIDCGPGIRAAINLCLLPLIISPTRSRQRTILAFGEPQFRTNPNVTAQRGNSSSAIFTSKTKPQQRFGMRRPQYDPQRSPASR
jgi:hypothetical protein